MGASENPYVYAGNNPLSNVDPSGQYRAFGHGADVQAEDWNATKQAFAHIVSQSGCDKECEVQVHSEWLGLVYRGQAGVDGVGGVHGIAQGAANHFSELAWVLAIVGGSLTALGAALAITGVGAFVGQLLIGAGAGLITAAGMAGILSQAFSEEAQNSVGDASTVGWFTKANIASKSNPVNTSPFTLISGLVGGGTTMGLFGVSILKMFEAVPAPDAAALTEEALSAIETTAAGLFVGAMLYGDIVGAAFMTFTEQQNAYLAEEEQAAYV